MNKLPDPPELFSNCNFFLSVFHALGAVVLGMLWLIDGLAGLHDGALAGGWWKGPLLSLCGVVWLAWIWNAPTHE